MTHIAPLLLFLTSLSLIWTRAEPSILCVWTNILSTKEVHHSFLRRDSASLSLRLYHSAWSGARALLHCAWSEDASVIHEYFSQCQETRRDFTDHLDQNFDLSSVFKAEEQCVSLDYVEDLGWHSGKRLVRSAGDIHAAQNSQGQDGRSEVTGHLRVKRGFIVPGTRWCGSGNKALSYADLDYVADLIRLMFEEVMKEPEPFAEELQKIPIPESLSSQEDTVTCHVSRFSQEVDESRHIGQLDQEPPFVYGVFTDTDSCCREHDQCKHTILSFQSQYGVFNSNIFTMSHCDCDNKFRGCLSKANDRISDVVGYTFFNLLKMHCFEFSYRPQCTQRNWFGMCKETKLALYAEVHPPTLYESTIQTEAFVNITNSTTNASTPAESDPQLLLITAAASTGPTPLTISPSTSIMPGTTVTETSTGSLPESRDDLEITQPIQNQTVTEKDTAGLQLSCGIYKDLDECNNKILPNQMRYGLHNPEPRTLYHCNCTTRLFQTLVKKRHVTKVQALLLGHVSRSCFLPQDCTADEICTAALVTADFPLLDLMSGAGVDEQRHLQAVKLKVRRPHGGRTRRKDRALKLQKLCLRMTRPKHRNKTRKHAENAQ